MNIGAAAGEPVYYRKCIQQDGKVQPIRKPFSSTSFSDYRVIEKK